MIINAVHLPIKRTTPYKNAIISLVLRPIFAQFYLNIYILYSKMACIVSLAVGNIHFILRTLHFNTKILGINCALFTRKYGNTYNLLALHYYKILCKEICTGFRCIN